MKVTYEWYNDPYFVEREDPEFAMENPDHLTAEEFYCGYLGKIRELQPCTESDLRRIEQSKRNYRESNWFSSLTHEERINNKKKNILKHAVSVELDNMTFNGISEDDPIREQRLLYAKYMAMLQHPKLFTSSDVAAAKNAFDKACDTYAERVRAFTVLREQYEEKRKKKLKEEAEFQKRFEEFKQALQKKQVQSKLCQSVTDEIEEVINEIAGAYYDTNASAIKDRLEEGYEKVKRIVGEKDPLYTSSVGTFMSNNTVMRGLNNGQLMMSRMKKFGKYKGETLYSIPVPAYNTSNEYSLYSFLMYYRFVIGCNAEYPDLIRCGVYVHQEEALNMFENDTKAFYSIYKHIDHLRSQYPDDVDLIIGVKEDKVPFDMVLDMLNLIGINPIEHGGIYTRGRYIQYTRNTIMRTLKPKFDSLIDIYAYTSHDEFVGIIQKMVDDVFPGDGSAFPIQKKS